ncbi:MAG: response regulator [Gammaproteobacteria bacterium]|nr:MAG: response regulator [Gammaproteobacteria bacterium]
MSIMPTTILIIEPSESNRKLIKSFIDRIYPGGEVELYDPVLLGKPSPTFPWSDYDLVIMDSKLDGHSGLDWMREFGGAEDFPPILFLSSDDKVDTAVQAMKLGARDYLLKKGLHYKRLKQTIDEILPQAVSHDSGQGATASGDESEDFDGSQTQVLPETLEARQTSQQQEESSGGYTHYDTQVLPESVNVKQLAEESIQEEADTDNYDDKTDNLHAIDHLPEVKPIAEEVEEGQVDDFSGDNTQVLPESDMTDPYMDADTVPTSQNGVDMLETDEHLGDTMVLPQAKLTSLETGLDAEDSKEKTDAEEQQQYWDEDTEVLFIEPDKDD